MSFRDAGWVWEGLGTHAGVWPSLYGIGEGYRYFGVPGVNFMFHPNNEIAFTKLKDAPRVVADISKWNFEHVKENGYEVGFKGVHDPDPETIRAEAENLSRLSTHFPNLVGGIIDDASGMFRFESYGTSGPADIRSALHSANRNLRLWVVVYANELDDEKWQLLLPHMDVANLWLWKSEEIPNLEAHVAHCAAKFPGKSIIVGSYLRDFTLRTGVPMDRLKLQYETMLKLWEQGRIEGFSILGAFLIDQDVEQAEWVKGFLGER